MPHCRYSGGTKLLNCRNAAGLTAANLAAKHGHVACAQLLDVLRKVGVRGVSGAAGDGRASTPAVEVPVAPAAAVDAGQDAGESGGTGKEATRDATAGAVKSPLPLPPTVTDDGASAPPAVSVVPEIVEVPTATSRTGAARTVTVTIPAPRRCMSALPAAQHGNQPLYFSNLD